MKHAHVTLSFSLADVDKVLSDSSIPTNIRLTSNFQILVTPQNDGYRTILG